MLPFWADFASLDLRNLKTLRMKAPFSEDIILSRAAALRFVYYGGQCEHGLVIPTLPSPLRGFATFASGSSLCLDYDNISAHVSRHPESLHLCDIEFNDKTADVCFDKLEELCVRELCTSQDVLSTINGNLQSASGVLRRLQVSLSPQMSLNDFERLRTGFRSLSATESLNYIGLEVKNGSVLAGMMRIAMMHVLREAVHQTPQRSMRVRLNFMRWYGVDTAVVESFIGEMSKLVTAVMQNTEHFMLICAAGGKVRTALMAMFLDDSVQKRLWEEKGSVVFSNRLCALNGFRERWLVTCPCCEI